MKDMQVPNMFPYKMEMIQALERKKLELKEQQALEKLKNKTQADVNLGMNLDQGNTRSTMFESSAIEEEEKIQSNPELQFAQEPPQVKEKKNKNYYKELNTVIEKADV